MPYRKPQSNDIQVAGAPERVIEIARVFVVFR